jgi:hypothetical protein
MSHLARSPSLTGKLQDTDHGYGAKHLDGPYAACKARRRPCYHSPGRWILRMRSWYPLWLLSSILWSGCLFLGGPGLSDGPSDGAISAEVEVKLASDQFGGSSGITVTTEAGVVTLVGSVERAEQKARAADLARQVKGVKRVKNDLDIRRSRPDEKPLQ